MIGVIHVALVLSAQGIIDGRHHGWVVEGLGHPSRRALQVPAADPAWTVVRLLVELVAQPHGGIPPRAPLVKGEESELTDASHVERGEALLAEAPLESPRDDLEPLLPPHAHADGRIGGRTIDGRRNVLVETVARPLPPPLTDAKYPIDGAVLDGRRRWLDGRRLCLCQIKSKQRKQNKTHQIKSDQIEPNQFLSNQNES